MGYEKHLVFMSCWNWISYCWALSTTI